MRLPSLFTVTALLLLAGCGQKGPLVRPDGHATAPVVIRGPASAVGTPPSAPPAKQTADEPAVPPRP